MLEYVDSREFRPAEEREAEVIAKLRRICDYAQRNAPAYRKLFDEAGFTPLQLKTYDDMVKIPKVTRDELVKMQRENPPFGGFLTVPPEKLKRIYVHPGPQYETLTDEDINQTSKIVWKLGLRPGDIVINALAYHLVPAGLLLDEAITALGVTVIPTGPGNTDLQVQVMRDLKVTAFIGFPLFLYTVVKRAEEMGFDVKRDLNLKIGLALGASPVRTILEQEYAIDLREVYAYLPVGIPCIECDCKSGMHLQEDFILEIVDPETGKHVPVGETGEVVITTLFNELMPRIRIGSGDLGFCTDEPCPCGRTSVRLVRIVGRVGEAVKVKGMFVHPAEVTDVLSSYPVLANVQVVVDHVEMKDRVSARFEFKEEITNKEEVIESFKKDFQNRCRVQIERVEIVPAGTLPQDAKKVVDERKQIIL